MGTCALKMPSKPRMQAKSNFAATGATKSVAVPKPSATGKYIFGNQKHPHVYVSLRIIATHSLYNCYAVHEDVDCMFLMTRNMSPVVWVHYNCFM